MTDNALSLDRLCAKKKVSCRFGAVQLPVQLVPINA